MNPDYIYFAGLTAAAVVVEHYTIGRRWRRNELARRTVGIATIMLLALVFVARGTVEWESWLAIMAAFGAAGAVKAALVITASELARDGRIRRLRDEVVQYAEDYREW